MAKKKKKKKKAKQARATTLVEKTKFYKDDETDNAGKNSRLAALASGPMLLKAVVKVDRIEIGDKRGWQFTYRA
ncbi:MAG: hypothetical protein AAF711_05300 [Planctomycetota bacterium]